MEEFSGFLLGLYRLAREIPGELFQEKALGLIGARVRFDSARWNLGTFDVAGLRTMHDRHLYNEPPEMELAYQEVATRDQPMLALLRHGGARIVSHGYQSRARFAGRQNVAMREYQRRFRHENLLMTVARKEIGTDVRFWNIAIYRAREAETFGPEAVAFMEAAVPHMLEALTINRVASLIAHGSRTADATYGVGISDLSGKFLHCEPRLQALLGQEWPGRPWASIPAQLWVCVNKREQYFGRQITAYAQCVRGMLLLRARPLCAADSLSMRELQVARLVAGGHTHKHVAREMGISPATARNYVQKVHAKLGVHSKAAVAGLLARMD